MGAAVIYSMWQDRADDRHHPDISRAADPDGGSLSLTWPGVLSAPSLDGDTATYADVLPGVDLLETADVDGFGYRLMVRDARAAANPDLARVAVGIGGDGLAVSQTRSGAVKAVDAAGKLRFESGSAMMWDSSGTAVSTAEGRLARRPGG